MKSKKMRIFRNTLRLLGIVLILALLTSTVLLVFSIKPPEGNNTLNRSGRVGNDMTTLNDENSNVPQSPPTDSVYTFLLAGEDKVSGNTDTLMLVKLDISKKEINILNIPRDTMLKTERSDKKINASHNIGGIKQLEEDVASITGFYVNRYVLFDIEGIENIIDAIGGVYFDVPRNMNYEDPTQDLYIHLKKGYQHLNGEDAVKMARYRSGYINADIGRISLQQDLLKALAKQALKPENILKLPELVSLINENIETDLDLGAMLWLANQVKDIPLSAIETYTLPGIDAYVNDISYWLPYKNQLLELINNSFNPLDTPISSSDLSIVSHAKNKEN